MGSCLHVPLLQPDGNVKVLDKESFLMSNQPPPVSHGAALPRFQAAALIAGRFEVVGFIARGGMGEVYEVKDHFLQGISVALKIIRPEIASDAVNTRRFEQEVILAHKVSHPNLCPIYDIFRSEEPAPGFLFLTMKFLHGETLDARMKRSGKIPPGEGLEICRQLLSGVSALHDAGIIHRDLKPNNIMLEQSAERLNVSIMDFGLARQHQTEATVGQTFSIAGTIGYMAPELLRESQRSLCARHRAARGANRHTP
jgi:serine/threonine protein kinase